MARPVRILTVCLGNICRSPVAAAAIEQAADDAGVDVEVDSAGTGAWHVGNPPDERMATAAARAGITVGGTARQVTARDLVEHDVVVAMDGSNLAALQELAASVDVEQRAHIALFRSFDHGVIGSGSGATDDGAAPAGSRPAPDLDVPDPYYGGPDGFDDVVAMVRPAAAGLVAWVRDRDDAGGTRHG